MRSPSTSIGATSAWASAGFAGPSLNTDPFWKSIMPRTIVAATDRFRWPLVRCPGCVRFCTLSGAQLGARPHRTGTAPGSRAATANRHQCHASPRASRMRTLVRSEIVEGRIVMGRLGSRGGSRFARSTAALSLVLVGALAAAGCSVGSSSGAEGEQVGISMSGSGIVSGTPDTLRATVGVQVERGSVQEALDAANEAAQRVIDAVREGGVADEDIQTERFSINPRYEFDEGPRTRRIAGYEVANQLTIKIRDIDASGSTLDASARAGGDDAVVNGVGFMLEDNAELLRQARERAFEDARQRAEQYAELAGSDLGEVVSIVEDQAPSPQPFFADTMQGRAESAVPIEPGSQDVEVRVTVRWELG
ncbi:SIMPL domain-containing protein [Lolliginicoccus lacisalsi]